jgi:hypothetical protein
MAVPAWRESRVQRRHWEWAFSLSRGREPALSEAKEWAAAGAGRVRVSERSNGQQRLVGVQKTREETLHGFLTHS